MVSTTKRAGSNFITGRDTGAAGAFREDQLRRPRVMIWPTQSWQIHLYRPTFGMTIITDERCAGYSAPGHPERPARISGTLEKLRTQTELKLKWAAPSA